MDKQIDEEQVGNGNGDLQTASTAENVDHAIIQQIQAIEQEVAEQNVLIGNLEDIACLKLEYSNEDVIYQGKIEHLCTQYHRIRKIRGDGNCFYRSFAFGCIEYFVTNPDALDRFILLSEQTKNELVAAGYPAYTVEDFYETFVETLEKLKKGASKDEMLKVLRDQGLSDYFVVYLRLMVSNYLQQNADFFAAFIEGDSSMKDFCSHEVEPMAKESDHIHIIALTNASGICVRVVYMDRGGTAAVNHHDFPEDGSQPKMHLLYSPGHYNILYPINGPSNDGDNS